MQSGSHNPHLLDKSPSIEGQMSAMTRRDATRNLSLFLAGSPLMRGQDAPWIPDRIPTLEQINNVMEFEPIARTRMLKTAYDYIAGGVDDEWTLHRNREGFQRISFRDRKSTRLNSSH